jgi:hypothetical protein
MEDNITKAIQDRSGSLVREFGSSQLFKFLVFNSKIWVPYQRELALKAHKACESIS